MEQFIPELSLELIEVYANIRTHYDLASLDELARSIREKGVLHPVLVRPGKKGHFRLVFGHRRVRAAKEAGLLAVPATVRDLSDEEALEAQILENCTRSDIHPLDEAKGYHILMNSPGYDVARIAERVGRSVKYVYDRVKLLNLTKQAQELFLAGKFTAGHAVLLARLMPGDQSRALSIEDAGGMVRHPALFEEARGLPFDDEAFEEAAEKDPYLKVKPVSVREFASWIDDHTKFDREQVDPMLFPETAATLAQAKEEALKIVPITFDYRPADDIRKDSKERIYGEQAWKRADGTKGAKECERSRVGVIVCGPGRGEAFKVCIDKDKCKVHWAAELREKEKRQKAAAKGGATGEERRELEQRKYREQEAKKEAQRARWKKALPDILEAVAEKVMKAPAKATGLLADLVIDGLGSYSARSKDVQKLIPRGKTAEDLVRHAALIVLVSHAQDWNAPESFPKRAKAFGVDVKRILDEAAPAEKAAK